MPEGPPKLRRVSISRKVVISVTFTLIMLALIALVSFMTSKRYLDVTDQVEATRKKIDLVLNMQRDLQDIQLGVYGYYFSGDDDFLNAYDHGHSFIVEGIQSLRKITVDDPEHQARLERIFRALPRAFAVLGQGIDRRRDGGVDAAAAYFNSQVTRQESKEVFDLIRDNLAEIHQAEEVKLKTEDGQLDAIGTVHTTLVVAGTSLTYIALLAACLFVLRDIAERRRAEDALEMERNLLRSIMDTIPDFIYVKDLHGRYLRMNEAYSRYLGLQSPDDAKGRTPFDFYPRSLAEQYTADEKQVLASGVSQLNKLEPSQTRDGREIWLETTAVPLRDGSDQLIGLVGLSSDVTQRRENDERLRHYAQALQRSNDELQNFASVASHDLQEPLRKIQAFGDRLRARSKDLGEQERDYITRMMDAASRMQTLVQDLLKLSRVTTRALPFEACDLNEIVRGVLRDLEVTIASTGARLIVGDLPTIEGDPTQLRQLLQNLIANGLKFHKAGVAPEVQIQARTFENFGELPAINRGAKICEILVKDNGIGFDQQFAEQIFGPFKRLHTRTEFEGSGIGLSVCRKITDRHLGTIVAKGTEGQGATFIVTLPVHQPRTTSP